MAYFIGAEVTYNTPGAVRVFDSIYGGLWVSGVLQIVQWRFESAKPAKDFRAQLIEQDSFNGDFLPWTENRLSFDTTAPEGTEVWEGTEPVLELEPWLVMVADVPGTLRLRAVYA